MSLPSDFLFCFSCLTCSSQDSEVGVLNPYTGFRFAPVEGLVSLNPSVTAPSMTALLLLTQYT